MEANIEFDEGLERAETELSESEGYSETPPSDIVAFNELRSCADLVRMHTSKQLIIKPDFQRDVVWPLQRTVWQGEVLRHFMRLRRVTASLHQGPAPNYPVKCGLTQYAAISSS